MPRALLPSMRARETRGTKRFVIAFSLAASVLLAASPADAQTPVDWSDVDCQRGPEYIANARASRDSANNFIEAGTANFTVEGRPRPPVSDWSRAYGCPWFDELQALADAINLPTVQFKLEPQSGGEMRITSVEDPEYDSNDTYGSRLAAHAQSRRDGADVEEERLLGVDAASAEASNPESWRQHAQLLPAIRWLDFNTPRKFAPDGRGNWLTMLQAVLVDVVSGIFFGIANALWAILLAFYMLAQMFSEGTWLLLGRNINAIFATVATNIQSFLGLAIAVIIFSVVRAYVGGQRVAEAARSLVALVLFAALFWAVSGNSARAVERPIGSEQLRPGTAAWVGYTVVNLADRLISPLSQRVSLSDPDRINLFSGDESEASGRDSSCGAYSGALYALAEDGGVGPQLTMISRVWETTYLSSITRAQFGESFAGRLPEHAVCHFADEMAGVSPADRYWALSQVPGLEGAYDSQAPFFRNHQGRGRGNAQPAEAAIAAAACRWTGSEWSVSPEFQGAAGLTAGLCSEIFAKSSNSPFIGSNSVLTAGPAGRTLQNLFGLEPKIENLPPSEEAQKFLTSLSPGVAAAMQTPAALAAVLSAVISFGVFGVLIAMSFLGSLFAVAAVGFLLPVILILLAVQSKKAKPMMRLAGSFMVINLLVTAIIAFVFLVIELVRGIVLATAPGHGLVTELIIAVSPALAVVILSAISKKMGFGSFLSGAGLLNAALLPLSAAATMSGVKSLRDMAQVDAQGNNAAMRGMMNSKREGLRNLSNKVKDASVASAFFNSVKRRAGEEAEDGQEGIWSKINAEAGKSRAYRDWDNEKKNRGAFQEATKYAIDQNLEPPKTMSDVHDLLNKKSVDDANDNVQEMMKAKEAGGELEAMKQMLQDPDLDSDKRETLERGIAAIEDQSDARASLSTASAIGSSHARYSAAKALLQGSPGAPDTPTREINDELIGASYAFADAGADVASEVVEALASPEGRVVGPGAIKVANETRARLVKRDAAVRVDELAASEGYTSVTAMLADKSGTQAEQSARQARAQDIQSRASEDAESYYMKHATPAQSDDIGSSLSPASQKKLEDAYGIPVKALGGTGMVSPLRSAGVTSDNSPYVTADLLSENQTALNKKRHALYDKDNVRRRQSLMPEAAAAAQEAELEKGIAMLEEKARAMEDPRAWVPHTVGASEEEMHAAAVLAGFADSSGRTIDMKKYIEREAWARGGDAQSVIDEVNQKFTSIDSNKLRQEVIRIRRAAEPDPSGQKAAAGKIEFKRTFDKSITAASESGAPISIGPSGSVDMGATKLMLRDLAGRTEGRVVNVRDLDAERKSLLNSPGGAKGEGKRRLEYLNKQIEDANRASEEELNKVVQAAQAIYEVEAAARSIGSSGGAARADVKTATRAAEQKQKEIEKALSRVKKGEASAIPVIESLLEDVKESVEPALMEAEKNIRNWSATTGSATTGPAAGVPNSARSGSVFPTS